MKKVILPVLMCFSLALFAQPMTTRLTKNSIPRNISYTGNIVNAIRWTDNSGDNIVITTETGITEHKNNYGEGLRSAALDAWHYLLKNGSWKQTWKLHDFILDCGEDLEAAYVKNTFAITDLDGDGNAEVWLMYRTVCHGDISPSTQKIIMYQADSKYAVRGTTRVKVSDTEYIGGDHTFDGPFKKTLQVFRDYANKLWKKNMNQRWN